MSNDLEIHLYTNNGVSKQAVHISIGFVSASLLMKFEIGCNKIPLTFTC